MTCSSSWCQVRNGRLAMLAFLGFCSQAANTGKGPLQNLSDHIADPTHNNSARRAAAVAEGTLHPQATPSLSISVTLLTLYTCVDKGDYQLCMSTPILSQSTELDIGLHAREHVGHVRMLRHVGLK